MKEGGQVGEMRMHMAEEHGEGTEKENGSELR